MSCHEAAEEKGMNAVFNRIYTGRPVSLGIRIGAQLSTLRHYIRSRKS